MKEQKQQYITIKGTREGITLYLDDTCALDNLLVELDEKLSSSFYENSESPLIPVFLNVGNRYLTREQEEQFRNIVRKKKNLVVETIVSNVVTREEASEWKRNNEVITVAKTIRSGQVLEVKGDLLLLGDVNPGGMVIASGNIFVMGALKGVAHAGMYGNTNAVIAASLMKPMQLRIYDKISRADESEEESVNEMECAFIGQEGQIIVDRLQQLMYLRPNLTRLERGMV